MATMSRTRASGFSEAKGSWNTGWIKPCAAFAVHVGDPLAFDGDVAGRRLEQAQDQARECGLAAARLAHDAQDTARRHGEGNIIDGDDMALMSSQALIARTEPTRRSTSPGAGARSCACSPAPARPRARHAADHPDLGIVARVAHRVSVMYAGEWSRSAATPVVRRSRILIRGLLPA